MRQFKFISLIILLTVSLAAQAKNIEIGQTHHLDSQILKQNRPFSVYLPPSYNKKPNKTYPVIYALDGDLTRFKGLVGMVESLSSYNLEQQIEEHIIVALPNVGSREQYLTPSIAEFTFEGKLLDDLGKVGDANKLIAFINKELFPYMANNFRVNNKRTLIGESFAGLFTAHVLLSQPELFTHYLITDATYIWHDNYLNRVYSEKDLENVSAKIYFALANNSHLGKIGKTNYQWGLTFANKVKNTKNLTPSVKVDYFEQERHGTVGMLAWYHGLRFLHHKDNY
ncbi:MULTISPECIES: alpha/beta hydrolase [unclassified Pseudoalteromonas]|uniref:alpha/beta hydrolase n=1 Tax=unclassified Pseudoalteromonas TaxID=194690 RepID=UPI0005A86C4F|nr:MULTISPECIES: alpha/beta hydrolase-fold protein [unclassified Pseudoalteromonas]